MWLGTQTQVDLVNVGHLVTVHCVRNFSVGLNFLNLYNEIFVAQCSIFSFVQTTLKHFVFISIVFILIENTYSLFPDCLAKQLKALERAPDCVLATKLPLSL
jgi:flagellar biosynthesis protein FlhB